ncbi:unnamed protein product [Thlaspi arvense]|uniref:Uncharacterized protein n=1 Tax=Thlaspi arvense TaxID=13288 RepID=A0AAU9RL95_THLAR|nr:unnamed protein product [Thlaspi arvense]
MDQDHKKSPIMERKKTITLNWDGLGEDDDDDDRFFETYDRLSSAVALDLAGDDDEFFEDCRMSSASAISVAPISGLHDLEGGAGAPPSMFGDFGMWMAAPGSITERRKKLLQGMGLNSNKKLISLVSNKLTHVVSKKVPTEQQPSAPPTIESSQPKASKQEESSAPSATPLPLIPVLHVRARSDGDIECFSADTKRRKEELIGPVSKQRLTRTSSMMSTPHAGICHYTDTPQQARNKSSASNGGTLGSIVSDSQFGAFFLIKNLDTGKEFIVKEFNNDGMWNRLSEVQTGKQLTMEEFQKSVGHSPVVTELMRRENVSNNDEGKKESINSYLSKSFRYSKKRGVSLLKNIKDVANGLILEKEREQPPPMVDQQSQKNPSSKWIKVHQTGKSIKEFSALYLCQEIQAHEGSIWTMKFSQDGHYLASAGEDRVIHVWEVQECEILSAKPMDDASSVSSTLLHPLTGNLSEQSSFAELPPMPTDKKKKGKSSNKKKGNSIPNFVKVPETVFSLSEKPICSFTGHQDDVLDLSWSKSQMLLSASMDKTVRLWDLETKSSLKMFAHNDYVTCIQFNPVDDDYFISGSLDEKVRIWSIPNRQLVDYTDLHEMVTAVCYNPDGQEVVDFTVQQFAPSNPSEVLVTSADSGIRIIDGLDITQKFRGFRNTNSQIAASFSPDGRYVVCASEDSQVYIWKRDEPRNAGAGKGKSLVNIQCHENFPCKDVSVAIPWPGSLKYESPVVELHPKKNTKRSSPASTNGSLTADDSSVGTNSNRQLPPLPKKNDTLEKNASYRDEDPEQVSRTDSEIGVGDSSCSSTQCGDSPSLSSFGTSPSQSWSSSWSFFESNNSLGHVQATAWGLVIVAAGSGGEIRAYQNFGLPSKVGLSLKDLT